MVRCTMIGDEELCKVYHAEFFAWYAQRVVDCNAQVSLVGGDIVELDSVADGKITFQHTATHCNTLQHTATRCDTLQHTATHYNTLQHTGVAW